MKQLFWCVNRSNKINLSKAHEIIEEEDEGEQHWKSLFEKFSLNFVSIWFCTFRKTPDWWEVIMTHWFHSRLRLNSWSHKVERFSWIEFIDWVKSLNLHRPTSTIILQIPQDGHGAKAIISSGFIHIVSHCWWLSRLRPYPLFFFTTISLFRFTT